MKKSFLWGGATAANQYEGGYLSGGRGISTADAVTAGSRDNPRKVTYQTKEGVVCASVREESLPEAAKGYIDSQRYYPSHKAVDFYHHYKEDIALMAEMGFKCFRMSVSWSRVCPNGMYEVNEEGLAFYDEVFAECFKYGIEPVVTLNHFDMPMYLADHYDGWSSRRVIDYYLFFCGLLFERYKHRIKYWITFNEINFLRSWTQAGVHKNDEATLAQARHHLFLASAGAVQLGHSIDPEYRIGTMVAYIPSYPMTCRPEDVLKAIEFNHEKEFFLDVQCRGFYSGYKLKAYERAGIVIEQEDRDMEIIKQGTVDFIGFSYYNSTVSTITENVETTSGNQVVKCNKNPYLEETAWGWAIDPLGLRIALNQLYDRYHLPLFIVENGMGAVDVPDENGEIHDDYRIEYLRKHIQAFRDAVEIDGVELMGYTPWGCIDLVSSSTGEMKKRYGFVYVDMDDEGKGSQKRFKKKSFDWYRKVIACNGEDLA